MKPLQLHDWRGWARSGAVMLVAGAACGVAGYGVGHLIADRFPNAGDLPFAQFRWSDILAVLLAFGLLVATIATLVMTLNPRRLGRMLKLEGAATASEISQVRWQGAVMALSSLIMILPPIFGALNLDALMALGLVALLLAVHTVLNLKVYRGADELLRKVVMEASVLTFWIGQMALFAWAAAERIAGAPPVTAWDVYVVLMTLYLFASAIVTARRGLA